MNSKYEFKATGTDTFELCNLTNSEVIPFKRTIDIMSKLQNIEADARLEMIQYMKSKHMKKDDLIERVTNPDGTVSYDESYYREFESGFMRSSYTRIADEIYKTVLGRDMVTILNEIGIKDEGDEGYMFGLKLREILLGANVGKNPSGNNESVPVEVIEVE